MIQFGDVLSYQTDDGGEINVVNGIMEMSGGLETSAYLSLFGGNEDDDGQQNSPFMWWGSMDETDTTKQYRSETQHLLQSLAMSSANLKRVENAVRRDLDWMIEVGAASAVTAAASIPALNKLKIDIEIIADGQSISLTYLANWEAAL